MDNLFKLNNGLCLPPAAYGTYKAAENGHKAVLDAIKAGYRYFDTASFYGTEEYIADAIAESGIARENFQICTKLWKSEMGYDKAIAAGKSIWVKVYSGEFEDWIRNVDRIVKKYGSHSLFLLFPEMSMEQAVFLLVYAGKNWSVVKRTFCESLGR